jgi:hypothetical protein
MQQAAGNGGGPLNPQRLCYHQNRNRSLSIDGEYLLALTHNVRLCAKRKARLDVAAQQDALMRALSAPQGRKDPKGQSESTCA